MIGVTCPSWHLCPLASTCISLRVRYVFFTCLLRVHSRSIPSHLRNALLKHLSQFLHSILQGGGSGRFFSAARVQPHYLPLPWHRSGSFSSSPSADGFSLHKSPLSIGQLSLCVISQTSAAVRCSISLSLPPYLSLSLVLGSDHFPVERFCRVCSRSFSRSCETPFGSR